MGTVSVGSLLGITPATGPDTWTPADYNAWIAAGRPATNAQGQMLDVRGQVMSPDAWNSTMLGIATQGGPGGIAAYNTALQQAPSSAPNFGNPSYVPGQPAGNTLGGLANGNVAPAGYTGPMTGPNIPGVQPGNVAPAGTPGYPITPGGAGASAGGANAPTGVGSIPGGQPNYPLDIGSYLNPMMGYALAQGVNSITNNAATAGMLKSGNTLKELMQYGMGVGANNFNNAANIAAGQQQFGYNVDNNDRNFAFNVANSDRNFNLQNLMGQAGLGLNATGQQNNNAQTLANIISRNLLLQGQNNMGATIGGSNAITNAISQILAQGSGNQSLTYLRQLLGG